MHTCPFCSAEIEETVALYGGTCGACFTWVPGEETPTDPGVDTGILRRKKQRQVATRRRIVLGLLLLLALGCGGLVWLVQQFDFSAPIQDREFEEVEDIGAVGIPVAEQDPDLAEELEKGEDAAGSTPPSGGVVTPRSPRVTSPDPEPQAAVDGLSLGMPQVTQRRRADVLEDADSIRAMVAERLSDQLPSLERCYIERLKSDATVRGRWRIEFVVQQNGRVRAPTTLGRDGSDAELEACMAEEMSSWTFDRIGYEFTSSKTLVFEPGS